MIKNQKQAAVTKAKLAELIAARDDFEKKEVDKQSAKYHLGIDSMNSLIADLQNDINEYDGLLNSNFHCLQAKSLKEIPKVLIGARLAQKMSHKSLGDLVGLKEQQIQRYEATDYETASWPRIVEIAMALQVEFKFEKSMFINSSDDFEYPEGVTLEQADYATEQVREKGLFVIK